MPDAEDSALGERGGKKRERDNLHSNSENRQGLIIKNNLQKVNTHYGYFLHSYFYHSSWKLFCLK